MKILLDFIVLGIIYFLNFKKWKAKGKEALLINTLMYVYLSFVLYFTLMPILTSIPFMFNHPYTPMNLVPFIDVTLARGDFVRQIILNIVMTIPFGFLFPLTKQTNENFLKTILACFLLSLTIEILQPLINGFRSSDITDLITNVIGGIIGYLFYIVLKPITRKIIKWTKET